MLVRDIEKAYAAFAEISWNYGPAVPRGALVHLCRRIDACKGPVRVLELGGGFSTLLWQALDRLGLLEAQVTTLLHEPGEAEALQGLVRESGIVDIRLRGLKQLTDEERERVFADPASSAAQWASFGSPVPPDQYRHYTIRNAFYDDIGLELPDHAVDVLIVDGPHGNGRSLAYPLLGLKLKPDALVLVDDFDHYPFLADMARILPHRELYRDIVGDKRWALVRLEEALPALGKEESGR
ncbi:hypothetical protein ACFFNY_07250 [Paenibacillus hodogayensis]|uniref:Class I SAM-dependent methyltransferase n=1 Tax=Paenibacillus hodogayensis TaxID=279208 RepID=A0ABV5VST7_9BACL